MTVSASLYIVGTFVGTFGGGLQTKYFGRKMTLQTANVVILVGLLVTRFGYSMPMLYAGRLLIGYSNGIWTQCAPVYTAEISQAQLRKFTGSLFSVSFTMGFALAYVLGVSLYWRDALNGVVIWPVINFVLLFACPESPTWLMNKGRKSEAIKIIERMRNNDDVSKSELARLEQNMQHQLGGNVDKKNTSSCQETLSIITRGTFVRPFLVMAFLIGITLQWCGTPALSFYLVDIIKGLKVPMDPYLAAALITAYRFVIVIVGALISLFVPRRPFYLICNVLVAMGTLIIGASAYLHKHSDEYINMQEDVLILKWLPLIGIILFYTGATVGIISVTFMLFGEILPSNAREIGTTLICTIMSISFFTSTKVVPHLRKVLTLHGLFFTYSAVGWISIVFGYFCIPETYGKSLEEIESHYRKVCYGQTIKIAITDPNNKNQIIDTSDKIVINSGVDYKMVNICDEALGSKFKNRRMSTASAISLY